MKKRSDRWLLFLIPGFVLVFSMACLGSAAGTSEPEGAPAADEGAADQTEAEPAMGDDSLKDPKSAIVASAVKLKELKSYRSKMWQEAQGEETAVVNEYLMPDRYRSVRPDGFEIIIIGDDMYTKIGDTWTLMTQAGLADTYMKVYATEDTIVDPQLEGKEDVNDVSCWKIRYTSTMSDGSSYEAVVWVGLQDGLPHKSTTEPTPGTTNVILYYDFDADITIEPPPGVE